MSKLIENGKKVADAMNEGTSRITSNLKEIITSINSSPNGIILEIPWQANVDGKYMESITVVAVKATKERIYFINPVKVSLKPCIIKEEHKKGIPRRIEKDGLESVELLYLLKISKINPIQGIIRETTQ